MTQLWNKNTTLGRMPRLARLLEALVFRTPSWQVKQSPLLPLEPRQSKKECKVKGLCLETVNWWHKLGKEGSIQSLHNASKSIGVIIRLLYQRGLLWERLVSKRLCISKTIVSRSALTSAYIVSRILRVSMTIKRTVMSQKAKPFQSRKNYYLCSLRSYSHYCFPPMDQVGVWNETHTWRSCHADTSLLCEEASHCSPERKVYATV